MKQRNILQKLGSVPFGHGALLPLLEDYKRPNDKIASWLASGELVALRKGLYVLGPPWRSTPLSMPLVANVLWGPSYVSLEFALSANGLIPEGVAMPTSVTTRRGRQVQTPLGVFTYMHLPVPPYGLDVQIHRNPDGTSYLMASPTQAVCDLVLLTRRLQAASARAMRQFLLEDMRIEPEAVAALDAAVIDRCMQAGLKTRQLRALLACVKGRA